MRVVPITTAISMRPGTFSRSDVSVLQKESRSFRAGWTSIDGPGIIGAMIAIVFLIAWAPISAVLLVYKALLWLNTTLPFAIAPYQDLSLGYRYLPWWQVVAIMVSHRGWLWVRLHARKTSQAMLEGVCHRI